MVDFFERVLPVLVDVIYSVVGALIMLAVYDWVLVPLAAGLIVPVCVLSYSFGRAALKLNRELNDELEREVAVINEGVREDVHEHYAHVRGIRIDLNDRAAWNFGLLEGCAFVLMAIALIRCCSVSTGAEAAGPICAVFGYILIFSRNLTNVPLLIEQISRMRDIYRRMKSGEQSN